MEKLGVYESNANEQLDEYMESQSSKLLYFIWVIRTCKIPLGSLTTHISDWRFLKLFWQY